MFIKETENSALNFADDNSLHASDPNLDQIKKSLERRIQGLGYGIFTAIF